MIQSLKTLVQSPEPTHLVEGKSQLLEFSSDLYRHATQVHMHTHSNTHIIKLFLKVILPVGCTSRSVGDVGEHSISGPESTPRHERNHTGDNPMQCTKTTHGMRCREGG